MMNDVAVGKCTVVVRPNRAVQAGNFEIMSVALDVTRVDDAVEFLMCLVDFLDLESIAVNLVD